MARILIVDDDPVLREMVALALTKAGHAALHAGSVREAHSRLAESSVDLVLSDIYMPGEDGLALLKEIAAAEDGPPVILMTARGSVETAAAAARIGAFDYLAKPFDLAAMLERVDAALRPAARGGKAPDAGPAGMFVGAHPAMVEVYKAVARVAPLPVPVLVLGETGTGKELVARALHRFGAHPKGPFVPVNCGALPDTLLESELFGHVRGAFTDARRDRTGALAQADGGTAFLDEVGEISPAFQVKLLRFLEDGVVRPLGADEGRPTRVRVVAATHRPLAALATEGGFRQDLYYRLAAYEIHLPPLRERLTDLPLLVDHFRRVVAAEVDVAPPLPASDEVLALLAGHAWPGNVRELAQVVRRLLIDAGSLADPAAAARVLAALAPTAPRPAEAPRHPPSDEVTTLEEGERRQLEAALRAAGGNRSAAARRLGIDRKTLARKIKRLGIVLEPPRTGRNDR